MQGILPVTGKMPVPQVLPLKWKHYRLLVRGKNPIAPSIPLIFDDR